MKKNLTIKSEESPAYLADVAEAARKNKLKEDKLIEKALGILEKRMRDQPFIMASPHTTREYIQLKISQKERECFHVLLLDTQHRLISDEMVFIGAIDQCSVHPREIVKLCLMNNAAAVILAHNHPSGVAEPSAADRHITDKLRDALDLVQIRVLDHFVVGGAHCVSFAERGWV